MQVFFFLYFFLSFFLFCFVYLLEWKLNESSLMLFNSRLLDSWRFLSRFSLVLVGVSTPMTIVEKNAFIFADSTSCLLCVHESKYYIFTKLKAEGVWHLIYRIIFKLVKISWFNLQSFGTSLSLYIYIYQSIYLSSCSIYKKTLRKW